MKQHALRQPIRFRIHPLAKVSILIAGGLFSLSAFSLAIAQSPASPTEESLRQAIGFQHTVRLTPSATIADAGGSRWYPRSLSTLTGLIVQFDAEQIELRGSDQSVPTRYASDRVVDVALTSVPEDQAAAIDQFKQENYSAALPALVRSISDRDADSRPAVWRQQWLSMLAAQAAMRSGRGEIAIELVKQLDARPLPLIVWALLPVDWTGKAGNELQQAALQGARADSAAVKLVAASWLLRSPEYRSAAETALRRLADQTDRPALAHIAGMLLWRTKSPVELQANILRWENEIGDLPMSLQAGPMASLLHVSRQVGLGEVARKWELILRHAAPVWHPDLP